MSSVGEMLNPSKSGHSLFWSLTVGWVFQIQGEVNDSHLNREEKQVTENPDRLVSHGENEV